MLDTNLYYDTLTSYTVYQNGLNIHTAIQNLNNFFLISTTCIHLKKSQSKKNVTNWHYYLIKTE